jgi:hypothetical protein
VATTFTGRALSGRKAELTMLTISDVILYQYAQVAGQIRDLKREAYQGTSHEKYAYRSPDGKTFRNDRPPEELMRAGWTYGKVKFERVTSHMRPGHPRWSLYRGLKRRATLLLAARLILKVAGGHAPEKTEVPALLAAGVFRPHARTSSRRKSLAYAACRYLRKLENRSRKHPERFARAGEWARARAGKEDAIV